MELILEQFNRAMGLLIVLLGPGPAVQDALLSVLEQTGAIGLGFMAFSSHNLPAAPSRGQGMELFKSFPQLLSILV